MVDLFEILGWLEGPSWLFAPVVGVIALALMVVTIVYGNYAGTALFAAIFIVAMVSWRISLRRR